MITDKKTILFQGDSITETGRLSDQNGLGCGYVAMVNKNLLEKNKNYKIINRGVSGNNVNDLRSRWQQECIDINPDILSIMVGVNDVWRKYDSNYEPVMEDYAEVYREILSKAKNNNRNLKIILMEPFLFPITEERKMWRTEFDPIIQKVRILAKEFNAVLVPLDGIFAYYSSIYEYLDLAEDGIHPSELGHKIIAKYWMKIFEKHVAI